MKLQFVDPITLRRTLIRKSFWRPVSSFAMLSALALLASTRAVAGADGGLPGGNTAEGDNALNTLTSGTGNTAMGDSALMSNTTGNSNTAIGDSALFSNITGESNTATGISALSSNNGNNNTADGAGALLNNSRGSNNTASGCEALYKNQIGSNNTGAGFQALQQNLTGNQNTAVGYEALQKNTDNANTAVGYIALQNNTTGSQNTATGDDTLHRNTTGADNTATGFAALQDNSSGSFNTAVGVRALFNNNGSSNIAMGASAGINLSTGSNNIDIGNLGVAGDSGTTRIGTTFNPSTGDGQNRAFIAGIYNVNESGTIKPVYINSNGQLGTQPPASSARFKDQIKPMGKTSEAILGLEPVSFHYKSDGAEIPQFGLIAEEVAKVNPDLVLRDDNGQIYTVRYDAVNAMMLNEFLKEHRKATAEQCKVEEQARAIQELTGLVRNQQKQIEKLTAGLQRVSVEVELAKQKPKAVANH